MRLADRYAFSLHTIKENKSRSILTVVISTFLSLLIMGLMCIAISFAKNGSNVLNATYFTENSIVRTTYSNVYQSKANQAVFNKDYYDRFVATIDKHQEVTSYVTYHTNADNEFLYTDPHYPLSYGFNIIEGRNILPSKDGNEVIISQSLYDSSIQKGDPYDINSVHDYDLVYQRVTPTGNKVTRIASTSFKVVGIYVPTNEEYLVDGSKTFLVDSNTNYIGDINIAFNANENIYALDAYISYKNASSSINPDKVLKAADELAKDLNVNMPLRAEVTILGFGKDADYLVDMVDPTQCQAVEEVNQLNKYKVIFVGGGAGIAAVLLLISVGSLANSIIISIDRSKKFIGLLKALGVRTRALKNIIIFESMTLISVGIIIGYILLWAISYPLKLINNALVNSLYGYYIEANGYAPSFYIPIYVLFIAIFLFTSLTVLFARGSLRTISKMDPIEVISEVS